MNIAFKFSIIVSLFIIGCKVSSLDEFYINDFKWKQTAIEELSKKYSFYVRPRMSDTTNNFIADLSYKLIDINRYPFGDGLKKLKVELASKKVSFDSIVCYTSQYDLTLDPEYLFPNSYLVFQKGDIISGYNYDPNSLTLTKKNEFDPVASKNRYKKLLVKPDGDNSALVIITNIKKDWSLEITKVIINADPFDDN